MINSSVQIPINPLQQSKNFLLPFRCAKILNIRILFSFFPILFWSAAILQAQTTIWLEDFEDPADGTIIDNRSLTGIRTSSGFDIWYSDTIDISAYLIVEVSADLSVIVVLTGLNAVRANYSIDNVPETLWTNGNYKSVCDTNEQPAYVDYMLDIGIRPQFVKVYRR